MAIDGKAHTKEHQADYPTPFAFDEGGLRANNAPMPQSTFSCSSCGAAIEVPDNYFKATIACLGCGASQNRPIRKLATTGAPQAVPYPVTPFPAFSPRPKKSSRSLIIALCIFGCVILGLLALAAIPLMATEDSAGPPEQWVAYTSNNGGFTARFPGAPSETKVEVQTALGQRTIYRTTFMNDSFNYEISYMDLGLEDSNYRFDLEKALESHAKGTQGQVVESRTTTHQGHTALHGIVETDTHYRSESLFMRVRDRVFMVICEREGKNIKLQFDAFVAGFHLGEVWLPAPKLELTGPAGPVIGSVGQAVECTLTAHGGLKPFTWQCSELPIGLTGAAVEENYKIYGKPANSCIWQCVVKVTDKQGSSVEVTAQIGITAKANGHCTIFLDRLEGIGHDRPRVGADAYGELRLISEWQIMKCSWSIDKSSAPPGLFWISSSEVGRSPEIGVIHAGPEKAGKFNTVINCKIEFAEFPGRTITVSQSVEILIAKKFEPPPSFRSLSGACTLFVLDAGPYHKIIFDYMCTRVHDAVASLRAGQTTNIWALAESKWESFSPDNKALPGPFHYLSDPPLGGLARLGQTYGAGESKRVVWPKNNLSAALASAGEADLKPYDSIVLITPLRADDVRNDFENLKTQLQRVAGLAKLTLIVVNDELPDGLEQWLAGENIKLIHQIP